MLGDWATRSGERLVRPGVGKQEREADVCLILEGSYPFVVGGVSGWTHSLIRELPELSFSILAIQPRHAVPEICYPRPENVVDARLVQIPGQGVFAPKAQAPAPEHLAELLETLVLDADADALRALIGLSLEQKAVSRDHEVSWRLVRDMYHRLAPETSFSQFFWIWHTLSASLFEVLTCSIPHARLYHTISTGYAGIFACRAMLETGRPMALTEHGLYAHERFVDLMSNDQLHDSFNLDPLLMSTRHEGRDVWLRAFESFARVCYNMTNRVITLSEMGRTAQIELGAPPERSVVIPNGINVDRFAAIKPRRKSDPPRIGFIGRVVAIKDVETFIRAIDILRSEFPNVEAWLVGPTEEEPDYHRKCEALVAEMGLEQTVIFKGLQDVTEVLGEIDLMVLTSISEAQPLTLLEAGAAGIPCVATDVGSCREIIMGGSNEKPRHGPGGMITNLISPTDTAEAITALLRNRKLLRARGRALKKRVLSHYRQEQMVEAYRSLYQSMLSLHEWEDVREEVKA